MTMVRDQLEFRTIGTFTRAFDNVFTGTQVYRMIGAAGLNTNELSYHTPTKRKAFKFSLSAPGPAPGLANAPPGLLPPGLSGFTPTPTATTAKTVPVPNPSVPAIAAGAGGAVPPAPGGPVIGSTLPAPSGAVPPATAAPATAPPATAPPATSGAAAVPPAGGAATPRAPPPTDATGEPALPTNAASGDGSAAASTTNDPGSAVAPSQGSGAQNSVGAFATAMAACLALVAAIVV
jgi:hypothetical protein